LALTRCTLNPVTGNPNVVTRSETQAISMGRSEGRRVRQQYGGHEDAEPPRDVSDIGQRLARARR